MEKATTDLEHELLHTSDIKEYCEENRDEFVTQSLPDYLSGLLESKNLKRTEVIKASGLQLNHGHQIFSGIRNPSRDKLIALATGFGLDQKELQNLLKKNGFSPLYARIRRDTLISYGFQKHLSVTEINSLLETNGEKPLFYLD